MHLHSVADNLLEALAVVACTAPALFHRMQAWQGQTEEAQGQLLDRWVAIASTRSVLECMDTIPKYQRIIENYYCSQGGNTSSPRRHCGFAHMTCTFWCVLTCMCVYRMTDSLLLLSAHFVGCCHCLHQGSLVLLCCVGDSLYPVGLVSGAVFLAMHIFDLTYNTMRHILY